MKDIVFDVNVILDVLLNRQGAKIAEQLFKLVYYWYQYPFNKNPLIPITTFASEHRKAFAKVPANNRF